MGVFQKLCGRLTNHKYCKYEAETIDAEPTEYYDRCKICRLLFWSYEKDLEKRKKNKTT